MDTNISYKSAIGEVHTYAEWEAIALKWYGDIAAGTSKLSIGFVTKLPDNIMERWAAVLELQPYEEPKEQL